LHPIVPPKCPLAPPRVVAVSALPSNVKTCQKVKSF
jgi:hypothetical protein